MNTIPGSPRSRFAVAAAVVVLAAVMGSQPVPREQVGPLPGGGFLLNSGWKLDPVGKQIPLSTLPMSTALSPDGKYLLVLNGGYRPPSISVIEIAGARVVSTVPVADAWLGLAFAPNSDLLYVGGGSRAAIYEFRFAAGQLTPARTFPVVAEANRQQQDFIGDVALSPDGRLIYAAALYRDVVKVVNPQSGMVIGEYKTGRRPYRILFHPDGKSYFVSHWADGTVGHYDAATGAVLATVRVGAHASDMLWRAGGVEQAEDRPAPYAARIFVAAANTNNVFTIGVSASKDLTLAESINVAMTPRQPLGMTPSALALSPDGKRLFVACSDANAAAVVDVSQERSRVEGFIPAGWYPTAVRALANGSLVVLNGKGLRSYANPKGGPDPTRRPAVVHAGDTAPTPIQTGQYMQTGTASWIEPFTADQLRQWTAQTMANSAYRDTKLDEPNPLLAIEHVIYIVKENRTYDQVLGDMKEGNGDPSLVLFGENVTPNLHKLAREFVLFDNFYVSADVSADGHNWSLAAIAPDYVQKMWPNKYANRRTTYDFEEQDVASLPPAGYLWTNAAAAGVSLRNYGYMVNNKPNAPRGEDQITGVRDPVLAKSTNWKYRGFDLDFPDVERARIFLADLAGFEKAGSMPRVIFMRLGNDHTSGTAAGKIAPLSAAADNDYAMGQLIEGLSKSRFWSSTAVFVLEDDAQNGGDHVDSHRSPAFVISPWARRHMVDANMYNTTSMLRTMELLLGMRPMTHFDAAARVMSAAFQNRPDTAPYTAEKPRIPLDARNPAATAAAQRAENLRLDEADENDDDEMNDILWRAIRRDAPPPSRAQHFRPIRSYGAIMPRIYLCFLWHMHQPFYKDLESGEYKLPWTRMHALKDYYGMVRILEEFPAVRQTFNLVPSMMAQVEEYAAGAARDPYLDTALKPAESLSAEEKAFLLKHSFYSDPQQMIYRYPRYGELYDAHNAQAGGRSLFGAQEFRDLQMWSQLAWFDEEFQDCDGEVREWIARGRHFTLTDQQRMGAKQREIVGQVLPEYARLAGTGQIEISTTPYYHPILPLLCDSNIAGIAHPNVPLPPRFRHPEDARKQLVLAREYMERHFGVAPVGLWPSEGSVSDEVFSIAAELGFEWSATDSGVLNRTRQLAVPVDGLYRPYEWRQGGQSLRVIFRDHFMSDLIGFVYAKMEPSHAAADFLHRIKENCVPILAAGRDALVPIILDGENAWEYYYRNGRPFLRELYGRISADPGMEAVTVSEGLRRMAPERLDYIFPGSWINANFDVWIGAEEDNDAWTQLLRARSTYEAADNVPEDRRRLAFEELMIAEGSDWCWWYGPEHDSVNRIEFDQLYRSHLANVYRFLGLAPPEELSRPILRIAAHDERSSPTGPLRPIIDGEVSSYFEWLGAGRYHVDERSGSMHGRKFLVREVHFGSDGANLYLRVDFRPGVEMELNGMEMRASVQALDNTPATPATVAFEASRVRGSDGVECAYVRVLEVRIPLSAAGVKDGGGVRFQFSLWQGGLPLDAVPQQGWIQMASTNPSEQQE